MGKGLGGSKVLQRTVPAEETLTQLLHQPKTILYHFKLHFFHCLHRIVPYLPRCATSVFFACFATVTINHRPIREGERCHSFIRLFVQNIV
jgi:hypothetical protein